jgi:hypothetical protein
MATRINVRSPFYIKATPTVGTLIRVQMQLYIYTGEKLTTPTSSELRYTISKAPIGSNNYVVFEISELVRDYLDIEFNGEYDSQCVWVRPTLSIDYTYTSGQQTETPTPVDYIALDGYTYFEEGARSVGGTEDRLEENIGALMSNRTIFRINDSNVRIPVYAPDTRSVAFYYQGTLKRTISPATLIPPNTSDRIDYVTVSGSDDSDTYQERVLADGGTLEVSRCLSDFLENIDVGLVDEVWVTYDLGTDFTGSGSVTSTDDTKTDIIKIKTADCSKYTPIKVTFVNKYGALQDLWFRLKSTETTDVRGENYKRSIFNEGSLDYKTYQHQKQSFQINGSDRVTMNTGYLNDDHNAIMEELMLSEQVWMTKLTDEELVLPIMPRTKSITYKTSLNDRLANYTIEFDMAFDKINNIR